MPAFTHKVPQLKRLYLRRKVQSKTRLALVLRFALLTKWTPYRKHGARDKNRWNWISEESSVAFSNSVRYERSLLVNVSDGKLYLGRYSKPWSQPRFLMPPSISSLQSLLIEVQCATICDDILSADLR